MHFCNTPYTFMDVLVLSWLYTLDKWQLDNWKRDFYYMSWYVNKKKKGSIKILTEVRFVGPFLCSHVMKILKLYEDMDLLCFSKDVSLLCFYVFVCVFLFPNISIRMGYLTLHSYLKKKLTPGYINLKKMMKIWKMSNSAGKTEYQISFLFI